MGTDLLRLDLIRISQSDRCTQGVLRLHGWAFAVTMEPPWRDNQPDVSCIPADDYFCARIISPHFGETFEITGVPNRAHILLHKLNEVNETKGCVGIGEEFGGTYEAPLIVGSARGFGEFLRLLEGRQSFLLRIIEVP